MIPRLPLLLVALGAVVAAACGRPAPPARADAGAPAPAASDCEARRAAIRGLVTGAPRACTTSADCGLYPGGPVDCGGVVDRATATRIWELTTAFRERECRLAVRCAPRAVQATCRDGRCVEEQLGGPGGRRP